MRHIHLHFRWGDEIVLPHIFHDADYFTPRNVGACRSWFETFADGIFARPIMSRGFLADHDRLDRIGFVLLTEIPSLHHLDSHGSEVARPNGTVNDIQPLVG